MPRVINRNLKHCIHRITVATHSDPHDSPHTCHYSSPYVTFTATPTLALNPKPRNANSYFLILNPITPKPQFLDPEVPKPKPLNPKP